MTFQRISHPTFSTSPGCSAPHIQQQGQRCRPNLSLRLGLSLENSSATPGTENLVPVYQQHLSMMGQHDISSPETQRQCMRSASKGICNCDIFQVQYDQVCLVFNGMYLWRGTSTPGNQKYIYNIYIYTLGGGGSPGGEGVGWDGVGWDINVLTTTSLILCCQRMFHQLGRP